MNFNNVINISRTIANNTMTRNRFNKPKSAIIADNITYLKFIDSNSFHKAQRY